ncbi:hypothetical protein F5Y19DRAFT_335605 [Xylariaceae sp. FL1651]|nr:hypothetical protein F5Y19DRAFT_335605 [Xylariaceae sp. FL1651]
MASLAAGIVDPTKAGKYRVVLSDALLGKDPKEVYTGIRYNHKPSLSSSTAPHQARIKPTTSTDASSYDLSFQDDGGRYTYQGTRGHEDNQYVLIFDPDKEVFVLHRVDSMFNMNLVRTPTNNDAESLRQEYPQLDAHRQSKPGKATSKSTSSKPKKPAPKETKSSAPIKKMEPPKSTPAAKPKKHDDSEEESSDDDLLTIEDPGGAAPAASRDFSPGSIEKPRLFSEFVQQQNEEDDEEDADGEEEEEEEEEDEEDEDDDTFEHFKLPSPINRQMMGQSVNGGDSGIGATTQSMAVDQNEDEDEDEDEEEEEEMEDIGGGGASVSQDDMAIYEMEAELEAELKQAEDSEVSEEE